MRSHRVLLLLRTGKPVFSFRRNRAPAPLLGNPIGGQDIQYLFPAPQHKHVHVLPSCPTGKTIDGSVRVLALEASDQEPVLSALEGGGREGTLRDGINERAGRAPRLLVLPLRIQIPKLRLILFLAQIIDQVVAVVADEDLVLFDDLDQCLHPARRRFNRQAGGVRRQNHPDLTFLHILKQASKRLTALAKLLVIGEIPHFAVVRCRIHSCLAVVVHML
ncbi:MAG: hypothetical protein ACJ8CB_24300 [Ktedonobacteraceae bacterium]